jgi:3-oxosteroid 1-dehydrogenase
MAGPHREGPRYEHAVNASWDVVILGSGIAGLAAALAAQEMGLRPLVLEKAATVGGGTVSSYGLIWIGQNHLAESEADTRDEVVAYLRWLGGGVLDEARMTAFVDRAPEALQFFERCGIRFRLIRGLTDHYYGTAPGSRATGRSIEAELIYGHDLGDWRECVVAPEDTPCYVTAEEQVAWGGINNVSHWDPAVVGERQRRDMRGKGFGLVSHFLKALRGRAVPVWCGQQVERLVVEDGRVTGVALNSGERIGASKGVVLATGGYNANPQLCWEFEQLPGFAQEASALMPASLTGDGLVLGAEIGGIVHKVENSLRVMLSYTIPSQTPGGAPTCVYAGIVELCSPHTMLVNKRGLRFADETFFQGIVPELRRFDPGRHEYPNLPAYLIFDSQYLRRFSFANRPKGSSVPTTIARADNLEDLAHRLGVDAVQLTDTVRRFNDFVAAGEDTDFHRGEHRWKLAAPAGAPGSNGSLGTIAEPPFYGVELQPAGGSSTGLLTDALGRVIHQRRYPIPGLYASGNVAAATEQGIGYQAGMQLAAGMTFSYLAARDMLGCCG